MNLSKLIIHRKKLIIILTHSPFKIDVVEVVTIYVSSQKYPYYSNIVVVVTE